MSGCFLNLVPVHFLSFLASKQVTVPVDFEALALLNSLSMSTINLPFEFEPERAERGSGVPLHGHSPAIVLLFEVHGLLDFQPKLLPLPLQEPGGCAKPGVMNVKV